ncbi:MAG TPA: glycosyltransferase family 2 protein [Bryobacteraceae bacterium]|nr:glycosyltransferase family 2 protein [Bryobacteraceae bacterium]
MSLTAVVPVWNGREHLRTLFRSLQAQSRPASELLVVDNGSTDGADLLARECGARVIPMGRNAGFAAAVNRGIRESRGEWIAILNSDVELAPDYFERLLSAAAPFATGKILSARRKDRIDATFDTLCRGAVSWRTGHMRPDGPAFSAARAIYSPPWTAVLFRAEVFGRVGLLNEDFESYLEDVDFGIRCAGAGISGLYVPEAIAWHQGSAALGSWHPETVRRMARNQCYLVARHYPRPLLVRNAWAILAAQLLWGGLAARHGCGWAWLRGKLQGLRRALRLRRISAPLSPAVLQPLLAADERLICSLQRQTGFDWYWRLYFLVTRSETK